MHRIGVEVKISLKCQNSGSEHIKRDSGEKAHIIAVCHPIKMQFKINKNGAEFQHIFQHTEQEINP